MAHSYSFCVSDNELIEINRSKSILIRCLIANYIYNNAILDITDTDADDVKIVHRCLQAIRSNIGSTTPITIDVKDCGAAYRFLLSTLAITPGNWFLTGTERLLQRPINPLVEALRRIQADIIQTGSGFYIQGKALKANKLFIDCSESSQFASSLLLIADKIGNPHISIPTNTASSSYITMTKSVINSIKENKIENIEADWSTAAFWYAFLSLSDLKELTIENLHLQSVQGDRIVADWFRKIGIESTQIGNNVKLTKCIVSAPQPWRLSFKDNPDLAPVMAVTAALFPFQLTMTDLHNLNHKESQRLDILEQTLSLFTKTEKNSASSLTIFGINNFKKEQASVLVQTHHDHRFVLAFSLLALRYPILLSDIECVSKSYPQFKKYFRINSHV